MLLQSLDPRRAILCGRANAERLAIRMTANSGQSHADSDRDRWFTAPEALEYGFIDHVYTNASDIQSADAPNQ